MLYRLTAEVDSEELSWLQSSVDEVINMLQQSPALPSVPEVRILIYLKKYMWHSLVFTALLSFNHLF